MGVIILGEGGTVLAQASAPSLVQVAGGTRGQRGADGQDGSPGTNGTNGQDGREVEFSLSATHIQWRYAGDPSFTNLIALTTLTGAPGADGADGAPGANGTNGRSVELGLSATHLQWRLVGDTGWQNVVALSAITGPAGADGNDGAPGTNGLPGADGNDGAPGTDGADGADGREVQLQTNATHIQWRYAGDVTWLDLILLSAITGPAGADGADGAAGANGTNGTDGADGADGVPVELQTNATHIQWRLVGGSTWTDLVALSAFVEVTQAELDTAIATLPYDMGFFMPGVLEANKTAFSYTMPRKVQFPANFAGSSLKCVASTVEKVFSVKKNGTEVGTITVAAAGTTGTFASTGGAVVQFQVGDVLAIVTPATADATLADVSITLSGARFV